MRVGSATILLRRHRMKQLPRGNGEEGQRKMGDEQLSTFQSAHLRWLKQQVNNLQDLRYTSKAPNDLDRQLFAAREELDDYVNQLREHGINI